MRMCFNARRNAQHHFGAHAKLLRHRFNIAQFIQTVRNQGHVIGQRHFQFLRRFNIAVHADSLSRKTGLQGDIEFAARYDIQV